MPNDFSDAALNLRKTTHKTVAAVTDGIDRFHFNTAVARIYELANAIGSFKDRDSDGAAWALHEALTVQTQLMAPMVPHLAEEIWQVLGNDGLLAREAWPVADPALLVDDKVTIAIQINGKLRDTLETAVDTDKEALEAAAMGLEKIARGIADKEIRKVIVVPNKIVNIVAT